MAGHVDLFAPQKRKRHREKEVAKQNLLEVIGHSCSVFKDRALAAYIDSEESLLPWSGNPELLIDRYDVRHLLSDLRSSATRGEREEEEELDRERYFDLENEPGTAEHLEELEEEALKRQKVAGTGYKSVGFSYEDNAAPPEVERPAPPEPSSAAPTAEPFWPPYPIPEELRDRMPAIEKQHQLMLHTAKFVHNHGGQTEVILRVKQGSNPNFGFLMPDDPLHPFFRYMVDHYEQLIEAMQMESAAKQDRGVDPISLVAAAYGDDSEDEGAEDERVESAGGSEAKSDIKDTEKGVVEEESKAEGVDKLARKLELASEVDKKDSLGKSDLLEAAPEAPKELPVPGVKFAIAKNPPLAAVRRVKRETSVTDLGADSQQKKESGKQADASSGLPLQPSDEGESELAAREEAKAPLDVNAPSAVNEPLDVNAPSGVNEPLAVNEPPLQTKRVIEKMVEYIARNGKHFKEVVRKRSGAEARFPFLVQGNAFYDYYAQELERALQEKGFETTRDAKEEPGSADVTLKGDTARTASPDVRAEPLEDSEKVEDSGGKSPERLVLGETESEGSEEGQAHNQVGLGSAAVRAAVLAATRRGSFGSHIELQGLENRATKRQETRVKTGGRFEVRETGKVPETASGLLELGEDAKPVGFGMDPFTAVLEETRASSPVLDAKPESKPAGLGIDAVRAAIEQATKFRGAASSRTASEQFLKTRFAEKTSNLHNLERVDKKQSTSVDNRGSSGRNSGGVNGTLNPETLAAEVARIAALEADSTDASLSASERKKAERLKRARLLAELLKGGRASKSSAKGSEVAVSHGIPADDLEVEAKVEIVKESVAEKVSMQKECLLESKKKEGIEQCVQESIEQALAREDGEIVEDSKGDGAYEDRTLVRIKGKKEQESGLTKDDSGRKAGNEQVREGRDKEEERERRHRKKEERRERRLREGKERGDEKGERRHKKRRKHRHRSSEEAEGGKMVGAHEKIERRRGDNQREDGKGRREAGTSFERAEWDNKDRAVRRGEPAAEKGAQSREDKTEAHFPSGTRGGSNAGQARDLREEARKNRETKRGETKVECPPVEPTDQVEVPESVRAKVRAMLGLA